MPRTKCHRPSSRINVVGSTGSGKTTVARLLAEQLGLDHIEIDALFWKPNWGETPDDEFLPAVDDARRPLGPRWQLQQNAIHRLAASRHRHLA